MWVILIGFFIVAVPTWLRGGFRFNIPIVSSGRGVSRFAWALGGSLVLAHILFH
jgi:hypothetical protein